MIQYKKISLVFFFHLSHDAIAINYYDLSSGLYMDINFYIWKIELRIRRRKKVFFGEVLVFCFVFAFLKFFIYTTQLYCFYSLIFLP